MKCSPYCIFHAHVPYNALDLKLSRPLLQPGGTSNIKSQTDQVNQKYKANVYTQRPLWAKSPRFTNENGRVRSTKNSHPQHNMHDPELEEQNVHINENEVLSMLPPTTQSNQRTVNQSIRPHHRNNIKKTNTEIDPPKKTTGNNNSTSLPQQTRIDYKTAPISIRNQPLPKIQLQKIPSLPPLLLQTLRQTLKLKSRKSQTH